MVAVGEEGETRTDQASIENLKPQKQKQHEMNLYFLEIINEITIIPSAPQYWILKASFRFQLSI